MWTATKSLTAARRTGVQKVDRNTPFLRYTMAPGRIPRVHGMVMSVVRVKNVFTMVLFQHRDVTLTMDPVNVLQMFQQITAIMVVRMILKLPIQTIHMNTIPTCLTTTTISPKSFTAPQ